MACFEGYGMVLNTQEFITKSIGLLQIMQMQNTVCVINSLKQIIFASNPMLELFKANDYQQSDSCAILLDYTQIDPILQYADVVLLTGMERSIININVESSNPEFRVTKVSYLPIRNPNNNSIAFIIIKIEKIDFPIYFHHVLLANPYKINKKYTFTEDKFLTRREHEIAFLLLFCKSKAEVTNIINLFTEKYITSKTVSNIIRQQLLPKFNVKNTDELLSRLYQCNYHRNIPVSLLTDTQIDLEML